MLVQISYRGAVAGVVLALQLAACEQSTPVTAPVAPPTDSTNEVTITPRSSPSDPLLVTIQPEPATAATDLIAVANDAGVTYTWLVNGTPVKSGSERVLSKGLFRRSDRVTVQVSLADLSARADTTIRNSLPRTVEVALDRPLDGIRAGIDLTAVPKGVDLDGDEIQWEYQWIVNDEERAGASSAVLTADQYRRGDRVTVRVTPSDGEARGDPYTPQPVTILNGAPTFVSRPPGWSGGAEYVYQVQAVDPDGDPVQYQLTKAPEGMVLDPETGTIRWSLIGAPPGRHAIEIQANDELGGTASQPFELDLAQVPPAGS